MEEGQHRVQNAEKNYEMPSRLERMPDSIRSTEYRDWAQLPSDVLSLIFRKLRAVEVLWPAQAVCRPWRQLSFDPQIWRCIDMRNDAGLAYTRDLRLMAMEAVDRSGGHVEKFYAEGLASDVVLRYIAERSTGLRCLAIISCYFDSGDGLAEFVDRCPLLEELQIINSFVFSPKTIRAIGRERPELNRFCLNRNWFTYALEDKSEALEIADNMPSLRELQLIGNKIRNVELTAILDKCLLLESLDIRKCFNVTLDESLRARLARIRNVRLPNDSTADYEFETGNHGDGFSSEDYDMIHVVHYPKTGNHGDGYSSEDY